MIWLIIFWLSISSGLIFPIVLLPKSNLIVPPKLIFKPFPKLMELFCDDEDVEPPLTFTGFRMFPLGVMVVFELLIVFNSSALAAADCAFTINSPLEVGTKTESSLGPPGPDTQPPLALPTTLPFEIRLTVPALKSTVCALIALSFS